MNSRKDARSSSLHLVTIFTAALVWLFLASQSRASAPAPDPATAKFEIRFMEDMIDHHAMAVQVSTLCLQKSPHPELKTLCANIVTSQSQESREMQSWLARWYGIAYAPQMTNGDMQMIARMAAMPAQEFEMEFLKMMIRHHWKAVVMATKCIDKAFHPELEGLCEDIVIAQSAEIEQLRTWLCDWYGECNYGPKGGKLEDAKGQG